MNGKFKEARKNFNDALSEFVSEQEELREATKQQLSLAARGLIDFANEQAKKGNVEAQKAIDYWDKHR